jgi:solute carrier family 25 uncoupling protein 27
MGTVRKEGLLSLYKGFFPVWIRLAPWQMTFWVSYEKLRMISGLESF